ncbi:MAG: GntG family PLP-dependent aldolase [Pseudomonadota bacterium]
MIEGRINLYSDTQTRPTPGMREAIASAPVGDEQHMADPSVSALCEQVAEHLGKARAVFLPSGTMCNEIAILVHCRAGDEIYAHETAHIVHFEGGGPAALAGAAVHSLPGSRGIYTAESLTAALRDPGDRYAPASRLVEVEQSANLPGGTVWSETDLQPIRDVVDTRGLVLHMDGARLPNAAVAAGVPMAEFARFADSVWIDLSKGLGCPVGGVLAGTDEFIEAAWRWKQRIGGAMRQAGMMAAAGVYALQHNLARLADDHANARRFADLITAADGVELASAAVETNLVFFDIEKTGVSAPALSAALEARGINIGAFSATRLRACTHLDVDLAAIEEAAQVLLEELMRLRQS